MARKRNLGSESGMSAAAAPAREKHRKQHAKRAVAPAGELPETNQTAPAEMTAAAALAVDSTYSTSAETGPCFDEIARLAYSYWEERGCQGGSPEEDWLRAEQELRSRALAHG